MTIPQAELDARDGLRECTVCLPCAVRCVHLGSVTGWLLDTEHPGYPIVHSAWTVGRFEVAFGRADHYCRCQGGVKHISIMSGEGPAGYPTRALADAEFTRREHALRGEPA